MRIRIEVGTRGDYGELAGFHYRAGPPATCVRVLRAVEGGRLAGVLVVSMPTMNGAWRKEAWPELFAAGLDRRELIQELNLRVRTISRVVVEPRWRGMGVARRLVRAYLDEPLSPWTEAAAAMGDVSPFFERAGMRGVAMHEGLAVTLLRRRLRALDIDCERLVDLEYARRVARRAEVRAALRAWGASGRGARSVGRGTYAMRAAAAGARLAMPTRAWVWP
jgi:GNAT superfamily N-acetyltransferase